MAVLVLRGRDRSSSASLRLGSVTLHLFGALVVSQRFGSAVLDQVPTQLVFLVSCCAFLKRLWCSTSQHVASVPLDRIVHFYATQPTEYSLASWPRRMPQEYHIDDGCKHLRRFWTVGSIPALRCDVTQRSDPTIVSRTSANQLSASEP